MDLGLSLPEQAEEKQSEFELRPGKLASWLESLPVLNLIDTSYQVYRALYTTNRIRLEDKVRQKLLETYRQPVTTICDELEKEFISNSLPLSARAVQSAKRALSLQQEMATGYKLLAQSMSESLGDKARDKIRSQLALVTQRAIYHLSTGIYFSYISYQPATPGVWKEIHRLFAFAQRYDAATIDVDDKLNQSNRKSAVARIYKKAILLDLSGPYHLPGRSVQNINLCLDKWGDLANLSVASALPKDSCQFLITKERDSSGEVYNGAGVDGSKLNEYLMLNTLQLARHVHAKLKALQSGDIPEEDGVRSGVFTEENSRELLGKLINAWGINPKRNFRRVSRKGDKIDIALGIESINFWLNNGNRLVLSSEYVGPMPQKSKIGTLYVQASDDENSLQESPELEENPELRYVKWDVIDESAGGLSVSTERPKHHRTKVGDIMGVRVQGGTQWEITVVRWIRSTEGDAISVGLQRLAPHAVPIAVNMLEEDGQDTRFRPALLLPEMPALKRPPTIVAEKAAVAKGRQFYMDNGFQLNEARATRTVESTSAFEQFEFSILKTRL